MAQTDADAMEINSKPAPNGKQRFRHNGVPKWNLGNELKAKARGGRRVSGGAGRGRVQLVRRLRIWCCSTPWLAYWAATVSGPAAARDVSFDAAGPALGPSDTEFTPARGSFESVHPF